MHQKTSKVLRRASEPLHKGRTVDESNKVEYTDLSALDTRLSTFLESILRDSWQKGYHILTELLHAVCVCVYIYTEAVIYANE